MVTSMLQAHSLLWHYLWIAPNVLLLTLAALLWRRSLQKQYPAFFAFAVIGALDQLTLYTSDVLPSVAAETWWRIFWVCLVIEALLKFALIGEIFGRVFDAYSSVAKLGKFLIRGVGVVLVLTAAIFAAYAPKDSPHGLIWGAHVLQQTVYFVEAGLLVFIFVFSGYFRLTLQRSVFGIALGLAISACVHLGTWAILANTGLPAAKRSIFDLLNMATYHVCVLIWFYYLAVPHRVVASATPVPPQNNLDLWNRELERLLQ
jgi:hypothetical protein